MLKRDWLDWKSLPVTKEMLQAVYEKRELLKEGIVEAKDMENIERHIGRCIALQEVLDFFTYGPDDLEEEIPKRGD